MAMGVCTIDASRRNVVWCSTVSLLVVLTAAEAVVRASPANCVDYCRGEDPYDMIGCISRCSDRADHQADGSTEEQEERGALILTASPEAVVRASPANCVDYCRGEDLYDMIGCISRCSDRADHQADGSTEEQEERGALILTASSEAVEGQTKPSLSSSTTDSSTLLVKILQNQEELRHAIHQAYQEVVKLSVPNTLSAPPSAN